MHGKGFLSKRIEENLFKLEPFGFKSVMDSPQKVFTLILTFNKLQPKSSLVVSSVMLSVVSIVELLGISVFRLLKAELIALVKVFLLILFNTLVSQLVSRTVVLVL